MFHAASVSEVTLSQVKDSWMITGERVRCGVVSTPVSTSPDSQRHRDSPRQPVQEQEGRAHFALLEHSSAGRCPSRGNSQRRCLKWLQFL